jgi:hypothetical protein
MGDPVIGVSLRRAYLEEHILGPPLLLPFYSHPHHKVSTLLYHEFTAIIPCLVTDQSNRADLS